MSETVKFLKVNKRYEGSPCSWCGELLIVGEDGAICEACGSAHHARCWNKENGCNGTPNCVNRPLQQLSQAPAVEQTPKRPLMPGESICPTCGDIVTGICFRCQQLYPNAEYTGPKQTLPEAKDALKFAIIGLFCFGFVLGPLAIVKGSSAKKQIANDPRYEGEGLATAAQIIGGIEIGLTVLYIIGLILREA